MLKTCGIIDFFYATSFSRACEAESCVICLYKKTDKTEFMCKPNAELRRRHKTRETEFTNGTELTL